MQRCVLLFGPCGPHLSYRCEKCMSPCIAALRLDTDSITPGSVVGRLNERHSLITRWKETPGLDVV